MDNRTLQDMITEYEELYDEDYAAEKTDFTQFECLDCSVNTCFIDEYYMVFDEVWLLANPARKGMLCIRCLEKRIGRELVSNDFTGAPVNFLPPYSNLLTSRLGSSLA